MNSTKNIKTNGASKVYRRDTINSLKSTKNRSLIYWRKQARDIFELYPKIQIVECVVDGLKTSSQFIGARNAKCDQEDVYVIVASTGGKWSKSRRDFYMTNK